MAVWGPPPIPASGAGRGLRVAARFAVPLTFNSEVVDQTTTVRQTLGSRTYSPDWEARTQPSLGACGPQSGQSKPPARQRPQPSHRDATPRECGHVVLGRPEAAPGLPSSPLPSPPCPQPAVPGPQGASWAEPAETELSLAEVGLGARREPDGMFWALVLPLTLQGISVARVPKERILSPGTRAPKPAIAMQGEQHVAVASWTGRRRPGGGPQPWLQGPGRSEPTVPSRLRNRLSLLPAK